MRTYHEVKSLLWIQFDGKLLLIIGEHWKGDVLIASPYDVLIISRGIFKKYKKSFHTMFLNKAKIIFVDNKN